MSCVEFSGPLRVASAPRGSHCASTAARSSRAAAVAAAAASRHSAAPRCCCGVCICICWRGGRRVGAECRYGTVDFVVQHHCPPAPHRDQRPAVFIGTRTRKWAGARAAALHSHRAAPDAQRRNFRVAPLPLGGAVAGNGSRIRTGRFGINGARRPLGRRPAAARRRGRRRPDGARGRRRVGARERSRDELSDGGGLDTRARVRDGSGELAGRASHEPAAALDGGRVRGLEHRVHDIARVGVGLITREQPSLGPGRRGPARRRLPLGHQRVSAWRSLSFSHSHSHSHSYIIRISSSSSLVLTCALVIHRSCCPPQRQPNNQLINSNRISNLLYDQ